MTKELLEQYPDICKEIEDLERAASTPVSDVVSGSSDEYPFTKHSVTIRGMPPKQHRARIEELKRQKTEIEQFVFTLPNSKLRRIATLRAIQGLSWKSVAAKMGHKYSEDTVRKKYSEIFK